MQNEDPKNSPATSEFFKDCDRIDQIIPHQPSPDLTITSRGYREINERTTTMFCPECGNYCQETPMVNGFVQNHGKTYHAMVFECTTCKCRIFVTNWCETDPCEVEETPRAVIGQVNFQTMDDRLLWLMRVVMKFFNFTMAEAKALASIVEDVCNGKALEHKD